ncbi:MAG: thermonuclease family protein [Candidatus Abawacabacteria bacterium]|nr:thermonuclease family protein [Candidatus Abawacabacteria bacterium]
MKLSKSQLQKVISLLVLLAFLLVSLLAPPDLPPPSPTPIGTTIDKSLVKAQVMRVIDGDTIELNTGEKVRYIGIDAPEVNSRDTKISCYANEATARNRSLVENKEITMQKDVSETDRYGRLLRYVYVDNLFVNHALVADGFARAKDYPPDSKYKSLLANTETEAKVIKQGLWGKCQ